MTTARHRRRRGVVIAAALLSPLGCSAGDALIEGCRIVQPSTGLPVGLEESSGVVVSRTHPELLWTHNDSGNEPVLTAFRANGALEGQVRIGGAQLRDWEDLAIGPCEGGSCLYVADTGDGNANRREIGVYILPEPDPVADEEVMAEYFPARFPDGSRDVEAMFTLPSGEIFLISKGADHSVVLYRYPMPLRAGETVTLEPVRTLAGSPQSLEEQVTGASASPSGDWVAIRSYKRLRIWRTEGLLGAAAGPALTVDLTPLGEVQGEAVALLDNGAVVLTSEGGFPGAVGTISMLQCRLETEE